MYISVANSTSNGFKKWADDYRPSDRGYNDPAETVPTTSVNRRAAIAK
jgi:hypothetical protein